MSEWWKDETNSQHASDRTSIWRYALLIDISSALMEIYFIRARLLHLNICNILLLLSLFTDFLLLLQLLRLSYHPELQIEYCNTLGKLIFLILAKTLLSLLFDNSSYFSSTFLVQIPKQQLCYHLCTLNINKFFYLKDLLLHIQERPLWVFRSYLMCLSWINAYHKKMTTLTSN